MSFDDPTVDSLIRSFRALDRPHRARALPALLDDLTAYEWRDVQLLLNNRAFHCDIVGKLPLELVLHVFSYLDITASCRLQTVCKRWHAVLSAPDFLNDALKRWFSAPLGLADNDQAKTLRLKQARNVQRFRLGRPYSSAKVQFRKKPTTDVLVGHLFCFVQGPQRRVCIINLRTAEETFVGSPRPIENMHASNEILAFSGFKKCYVRSTSTDDAECKEFRIPGVGRTRSLTCSGRTVAYSYTTYSDQQPYHMNIYLFDYDSGRGHSFCPPFPEIAPEYAHLDWETHEVVLLDSRSRTVAVFYDNTSDDFSSLVYYVLCSFAGDKISCGSIRLRGVKLECFDGPVVVDRKGTPAITISSYVDVEVRSSLHQRSDDRTGSYRQMFLICPPEPGKEEYILQEIELNTMVCAFEERIGYWNGVVYKGIGCKQGPAAFCLRAGKWEKMDEPKVTHRAAEESTPRHDLAPAAESRPWPPHMLLNGDFLILSILGEDSVLYSFDEDVDLTPLTEHCQI